jgi:thiamine-phosphate pyrophosphorylase
MTDERMGAALLPSIAALPKASGVVFRHYSLLPDERRALFARVRKIARKRRLVLILAGSPKLACAWKADGIHGRARGWVGAVASVHTAPVHNVREVKAAERNGADLLFASPLFATKSHKGKAGLGRVRFGMLIAGAKRPIIALGGMNPMRARSLSMFQIYGWAGIDALIVRI